MNCTSEPKPKGFFTILKDTQVSFSAASLQMWLWMPAGSGPSVEAFRIYRNVYCAAVMWPNLWLTITLYGMFTVRIVPHAFHIQTVEDFWKLGILILSFQMRKPEDYQSHIGHMQSYSEHVLGSKTSVLRHYARHHKLNHKYLNMCKRSIQGSCES